MASEEQPLLAYAALAGAFSVALGAVLVKASGRRERTATARDLVLFAVATQRISRLITRDRVASFVRAPFTEHQEPAGQGEVTEEPRGHGLRLAIGQLLVCPYCSSLWIAAGFVAGHQLAPRTARTVSAVFATLSLADVAQLAYVAARERATD